MGVYFRSCLACLTIKLCGGVWPSREKVSPYITYNYSTVLDLYLLISKCGHLWDLVSIVR